MAFENVILDGNTTAYVASYHLNIHNEYDYSREVDTIYPTFLNELVVAGGEMNIYGYGDKNFAYIVDRFYDLLIPYITPAAREHTKFCILKALIKRLKDNGFKIERIHDTHENCVKVSI